MSYTSIITFALISLLVLVVVAILFIAIAGNFKRGLRFREELAQRVKFLRLDKMLARRNIKREHYLHVESVANIENQIRSCESCSATKQCDEALKESSPADLSFCPNDKDFEIISNNSDAEVSTP